MSSLQQNWRKGQNRTGKGHGKWEEITQTMYAHMNKEEKNKHIKRCLTSLVTGEI
jgi:hypothetical protein